MSWYWWMIIGIYVAGFIWTTFANPWFASPITFGLCMLRAVLWPVYLATGWPSGQMTGPD